MRPAERMKPLRLPHPFKEAIADLLKAKPEPKKKPKG